MPVEEDYVRAILPDPPPASPEDRNAVVAAVLAILESPEGERGFVPGRRQPRALAHRLVVVGVAALILAVFFVPMPRTSLFGRLDRAGSSGPKNGGAPGASNSELTRNGFALRILDEARVPPLAHVTTRDVSGALGQVFETPDVVGLLDLHRFYLVDELAGAVESYVQAHLPKGAQWMGGTSSGTAPSGGEQGYAVSLPVSGPHDYLAELVYYFQPVGATGDETEIRLDSQTVWEPSRSAGELAPARGIVEVTGFSQTGAANPSSVSVTFPLNAERARALRTAFNALPLGPPENCRVTGDMPLYRIVFRPTTRSGAVLEAEASTCTATEVVVTAHGHELPLLYDRTCSLLRAVVAALPPGKADTTRHVLGCRTS